MIIKHNIVSKLRRYNTTNASVAYQIQLHVTFGGERWITSTGCIIADESAWDKESQLVKPHYRSPRGLTAVEINNKLRICREEMETTFKFFEVNDLFPSKQQVIDKYTERMSGHLPEKPVNKAQPSKLGLFDVFDLFVKECGENNSWSKSTHGKMAALRNDLESFDPGLSFADLTESKLTEWMIYLRDAKVLRTPRRKKEERTVYDKEDFIGLKNSTLNKKIDFLRWFLTWATEKGYNQNTAYQTFRPTLKQTQKKVIYLTKEELQRIQALDLSKNTHLEPVRDVFLFCCFTGLRFSDVYNLKRTDIKDDHIEVTTVKTADSISVELNKISREILDKYKNIKFPGGKALPVMQNQPMNRCLKKLSKMAKIDEEIRITTYKGRERQDVVKKKWELVGTHAGRRTFIVNALSLGIAPNVIMKWTGHSDYKAMKPYVDVVDEIKAKSMTKFDQLLKTTPKKKKRV